MAGDETEQPMTSGASEVQSDAPAQTPVEYDEVKTACGAVVRTPKTAPSATK